MIVAVTVERTNGSDEVLDASTVQTRGVVSLFGVDGSDPPFGRDLALTLTERGATEPTVTVQSDSWDSFIQDLGVKLAANGYAFSIAESAAVITITGSSPFFLSVESAETEVGSTASGAAVEVELTGQTDVWQVWNLVLDGTTTLSYQIVNAASAPEVIDQWVLDDSGVYSYVATSNRNPRITDVAEAVL